MNDRELAAYLSILGYSVYESKGMDVEALLFGEPETLPIDATKFNRAAQEEKYVYTRAGWIKFSSQ